MAESGSGAIINFAPGSGVDHPAGRAAYNASKAGVISLSKTMARDYHRHGVRINAVCPGIVGTSLTRGFYYDETVQTGSSPEVIEQQRSQREMYERGQLWEPDDVLETIVFLASPAGRHINGQFVRMTQKLDPGVHN
jgi:NAD(P)-dependent dehydrogenase (short-subunit alcohol dehydrogenase family)